MKRELNDNEKLAIEIVVKDVLEIKDLDKIRELVTLIFRCGYVSGVADTVRHVVKTSDELISQDFMEKIIESNIQYPNSGVDSETH